MSEEFFKIEVDGVEVEARKGAMIIEVTDAMGITIPRFCYHKKLSIAANCRMCLVDVERAPKPLPACATPVMKGMKVRTDSARALDAQKGTMEFLLINHPLDCPICDQGGECELQDVAMGYGGDVSRFAERKRVVKDKDIGPLIATEMTRCIHCTRCVRFGDEIAGLRELGATGRGEHMEIGTYIATSIESELSGNVIDLCPVGALTAKPSRYTGRSWEYVQRPAVAPHDAIGSNIFIHTIRNKIMRVVPRENEAVNETWISDRDRFSYEGVYSADRVVRPQVKTTTGWSEVEWSAALEAAGRGLERVIEQHGPEAVGFLVSPTATLEEMFLVQKLARGLGVGNIDYRLRWGDFSRQDGDPVYPWLGQPLEELERLGAALLIGSNVRMEQPIAGHRIRKAALSGGKVMFINPRNFDVRFPVAAGTVTDPAGMVSALAGVAAAVVERTEAALPDDLTELVGAVTVRETDRTMAANLLDSDLSSLFLGNLALAHPAFSALRSLAVFIARASGSRLGYLPDGANAVGGHLAGVLPHRGPAGETSPVIGLDARAMLASPRKAYVLLGVEPEFDCWDAAGALAAMKQAELVIVLSPFASERTRLYADVVLPVGTFAETAGTFVNLEGRWQSFKGAIRPLGEARPAWKVLRVLGNTLNVNGFDYMDSAQVLDEVRTACEGLEPDNLIESTQPPVVVAATGPQRVADVPIYAVDPLVRRSAPLQRTPLARTAEVRLHPAQAEALGLANAVRVRVRQNGNAVVLPLVLDESVAEDCVWLPASLVGTVHLGAMVGDLEIEAAADDAETGTVAQ
jgi:NADH-quinone oxidoreductase subunit G